MIRVCGNSVRLSVIQIHTDRLQRVRLNAAQGLIEPPVIG